MWPAVLVFTRLTLAWLRSSTSERCLQALASPHALALHSAPETAVNLIEALDIAKCPTVIAGTEEAQMAPLQDCSQLSLR